MDEQCTEAEWLLILAFILRTTDAEVIEVRQVSATASQEGGDVK